MKLSLPIYKTKFRQSLKGIRNIKRKLMHRDRYLYPTIINNKEHHLDPIFGKTFIESLPALYKPKLKRMLSSKQGRKVSRKWTHRKKHFIPSVDHKKRHQAPTIIVNLLTKLSPPYKLKVQRSLSLEKIKEIKQKWTHWSR